MANEYSPNPDLECLILFSGICMRLWGILQLKQCLWGSTIKLHLLFSQYLPVLSVVFLLLRTHVQFPSSVPTLLSSTFSASLGTPITRGWDTCHWVNQDTGMRTLMKFHFSQHINCFLIFWEESWSLICASAVNLWCDHRFYSLWNTTQ